MKSILRFVLFVIILCWRIFPAAGQITLFDQNYSFSISGGLGFLYGTSYEIVYRNSGSKDYLSELQWEIKPLLYLGLNVEFGPQNPLEQWGLFANLGVKAGLPMETGIMEDRDWMPQSEVPGSLTHFSSHDNYTRAAFLINLGAGLSLPLSNFLINLSLNFDYWYFKWEGRNGFLQYGPNRYNWTLGSPLYQSWSPNFEKVPITGLAISYTQHWLLTSFGIGAEYFLDRFTFSAAVLLGFANCKAIDDHHLTDTRFTGILSMGFTVRPKLGIFFSISDSIDIGLSAAYIYIGETRGDTEEISGTGNREIYRDAEGAAFRAFDVNLLFRFRLVKP